MALFGRRPRGADAPQALAADAAAASDAAQQAPSEPEEQADAPARGPWDADQAPDLDGRVDLGAILIPARQGMALRMELDRATKRVIAANVTLGQSNLQLQAFAAPKSSGIWEEIREQIATSVKSQGGAAQESQGPFGPELLALLPVRDASGNVARRPARFIGVDGPRWFLRGVLTGAALADKSAAREVEAYFSHIVVVRGTEARPPSELLTLTMPGQKQSAPDQAQPEDILTRGPEISEVR